MPSAFCLLPFAYCLLPIAFCLLPFAYCLLPIAFCLLPIAFCLFPSALHRIHFAYSQWMWYCHFLLIIFYLDKEKKDKEKA
ncbi:MAG: hypothetical protein F6K56_11705 [Moorea sp. SIO3G5]|nr:hypothetical protein [Moorena sp. SIO3G5]